MKRQKCQLCHNILNSPDPAPINSVISIQTPDGSKTWKADELCAAAVEEFILEFMDDVRTGFREQDEQWRLRRNRHLQKKLPEELP